MIQLTARAPPGDCLNMNVVFNRIIRVIAIDILTGLSMVISRGHSNLHDIIMIIKYRRPLFHVFGYYF